MFDYFLVLNDGEDHKHLHMDRARAELLVVVVLLIESSCCSVRGRLLPPPAGFSIGSRLTLGSVSAKGISSSFSMLLVVLILSDDWMI